MFRMTGEPYTVNLSNADIVAGYVIIDDQDVEVETNESFKVIRHTTMTLPWSEAKLLSNTDTVTCRDTTWTIRRILKSEDGSIGVLVVVLTGEESTC